MIFIIDLLETYYGFDSFNILYKSDNKNVIKNNDKIYYFEKIENIDEVYEQYSLTRDIQYFYKFIANKNNSIFTEYNGKNYVLLLVNNGYTSNIIFPIFIENNKKLEWRNLWIQRIEYIENYVRDKNEYLLIFESIDYYIGLFELAIFYLGGDGEYYGDYYLQHKRFNYDDLYNPLNIKKDFRERDFAEYLKYIFLNGEYKNIDIHNLFLKNKNNYNFNLVLARVIYPNYYFDLVDDIIFNNSSEIVLNDIINRNKEFEDYIRQLIKEISLIYPIKKISFMRF